jgi:hypothetical protein
MLKRTLLSAFALVAVLAGSLATLPSPAQAAGTGQPYDWNRFHYYPYVYYPQNFQRPQQFDNLYYRYPPERRIPVYRTDWHNFYPSPHPYHMGHHFILDVF